MRTRILLWSLCVAPALFSTTLTFTSGTLLWARQADFRVFDVTQGGDLSGATELIAGSGFQNGQIAFSEDLTTGFMTGASSRRILKFMPDSTTPIVHATLPAAAYGMVVTPEGKIYASSANGNVYDVTTGTPVVVASGLKTPRNMLWTPTGILVVEQGLDRVTKLGFLGGNTGPAESYATGVIDGKDIEMFNGRIYVTSLATGQVYDITSGGEMTAANIFATGQSFIGLARVNGKLYASNFAEMQPTTTIFDITSGGTITSARIFGYGLPGGGETMFDAVPSAALVTPPPGDPDETAATPEASTWMLFGTGALLAGLYRRSYLGAHSS